VAERDRLRERVQRRGMLRVVQPEREAMQRSNDANLRFERDVAGWSDVREPSVRQWQLLRGVRPRRQALFEQRRADVYVERSMGHGCGVCLLGVRRRSLLGCLCAGSLPVRG
jgi:hypothetical protein